MAKWAVQGESLSISCVISFYCNGPLVVVYWPFGRGILTLWSWYIDPLVVVYWPFGYGILTLGHGILTLWSWYIDPLVVVYCPFGHGILTLWSWYTDPLVVVYWPFGHDWNLKIKQVVMSFYSSTDHVGFIVLFRRQLLKLEKFNIVFKKSELVNSPG